MARPRKIKYKDLPVNLLHDVTNNRYVYRHPQTKKFHSMGNDKKKAVDAAKQLNSLLMQGQDLIAGVLGINLTLEQFLDQRFLPQLLPERNLSPKTVDGYKRQIIHIKKGLGALAVDAITVKHIADYLNKLPPVNANRHRSLLSLIFKYAVAEGLTETNPAANTFKRITVKKRKRLKKTEFDAIYNIAEPWLKNAMDIAIITLQRIGDISRMEFNDVKEGYVYVIQNKTKKHGERAYIKIKVGTDLKKIIARCRDNAVSPYLIHRLPDRYIKSKCKTHHTQVTTDYLSKAFSEARDATKLFDDVPAKERPTFHEIRSLGIKLYEEQGINPDNLAGHMTEEMKKHYRKGHGIEWTEAASL